MGRWPGLALMIMAGAALVTAGCARKDTTFERAGKKMDTALQDVNREMQKTLK